MGNGNAQIAVIRQRIGQRPYRPLLHFKIRPGNGREAWIPEPSATGLREADLNVLAKLGEQGLEWRLEAEAFARREVCGEDDLLDFLFGHSVDIQVTRQP
jgi:hypothetical protein